MLRNAKKNLEGVFLQVKKWCLKIPLNKSNNICFIHILRKHPLRAK